MSERNDLTRWNRASLTRFRYVDGKAAEYLEILRQQLVAQFADTETGLCEWLKPAKKIPANEEKAENETLIQRQERLSRTQERILEMYHQDRRDWAWEITRTFARACHILTEHTNAYANEGYLGTATQWDNVRRLVEMLDYHPAPPASASTRLALIVKKSITGLVKKGWQVKYKPPEGGDKVVFETLEELTVDSALNELRPKGWNQSNETCEAIKWRVKRKPRGIPDEVALIFREAENEAEAVTIGDVDETSGKINGLIPSPVQNNWGTWPKSESTLHVSPRWQRECWLNGSDVIRTDDPHGLTEGAFISWKVGTPPSGPWQYAEIIKADKRSLRLRLMNSATIPVPDRELFQLTPIKDSKFSSDYEVVVLLDNEGKPDVNNPPSIVDVAPEINNEAPFGSIFTVRETAGVDTGGGGGLLPPATLPNIGSFLFPSPMLPMDLVKAAVELMLSLGVMQIPSNEEFVIKGLPPKGNMEEENINNATQLYHFLDNLILIDGEGQGIPVSNPIKLIKWENDEYGNPRSEGEKITELENVLSKASVKTALFQKVTNGNVLSAGDPSSLRGKLLTLPTGQARKAVVAGPDDPYMFNGTSDKVKVGDWVVGQFTDALRADGHYRALKVSAVNKKATDSDGTETFSLSFEDPIGDDVGLEKVYAEFRGEYIPEVTEINNTQISSDEIELDEEVPESLKVGQNVLLTADGKEAVAAKIVNLDGKTITTDPPADSFHFTKGELIIRGNVVLCGHGEAKPAKILGSGDAAKSNQEFTLEVVNVSFTPDATKSSGVAAAIEVEVAGRVWEQVSTLKDSAPDDHHYAIRMTEEGYIKILFGDGEHGRRLPRGKNNVQVRYRVGSGLTGNVPTGSLEKPVNPHPLIETVLQPLLAAGGGDMENVNSLRENAPFTLLALERAVSLTDFSHLAAGQSSAWQAKAYSQILHGGRMKMVKVVIVPAGGITSEDIEKDMENFLQKHALPGVCVEVEPFIPVLFDLKVTVRVKSDEFIPEDVDKAITFALSDHFTLRNRKLGEHLYLSEVYKIVEGIQGVENSICVLNGDKAEKVIEADDESTVIYLDTRAGSTLDVTHEEYRP